MQEVERDIATGMESDIYLDWQALLYSVAIVQTKVNNWPLRIKFHFMYEQ